MQIPTDYQRATDLDIYVQTLLEGSTTPIHVHVAFYSKQRDYIICYQGSPQDNNEGLAGGRGLGGVCDHINHFGSHIKEIGLWKAWGAAMLKGPEENSVL